MQGRLISGVDEVGRGPLAGPVVAAAVILDPERPIAGLADSKALTAKRREALYELIQQHALAWAIGRAEVAEIDSINIFQASLLAMRRAVESLAIQPQHIQVDGKHLPSWSYSAEAIIKGDSTVPAISAASIIAKVTRDREMSALHADYPDYGFAQHKGYPTKMHLTALQQHGVTPLHRRSFAPVARVLMATADTV